MSSRTYSIALIGIAILLPSLASSLAEQADSGDWSPPRRAVRRPNPIPSSDKAVAGGRNVYIHQCIQCHGATGKGDGSAATDLHPSPPDLRDSTVATQTDGALFWKISSGRKPMPSFEKLIPENDRWQVIHYLRTFARPAATRASAD